MDRLDVLVGWDKEEPDTILGWDVDEAGSTLGVAKEEPDGASVVLNITRFFIGHVKGLAVKAFVGDVDGLRILLDTVGLVEFVEILVGEREDELWESAELVEAE